MQVRRIQDGQSNNRTHTFAIAFDIRKPAKFKEKLIYHIGNICFQHASPINNDGKRHYLVLDRDTLIEVVEPQGEDLLSISVWKISSALVPFP